MAGCGGVLMNPLALIIFLNLTCDLWVVCFSGLREESTRRHSGSPNVLVRRLYVSNLKVKMILLFVSL